MGAESVREQDKIQLVLAYLGIFGLIPLLTVKDSPFVQWHAKQGLVLAAAVFLLGFVPIVQCIAVVGWLVVAVLAMSKALKGERWRLPLLADLVDKL